jgi:hypothetical protein
MTTWGIRGTLAAVGVAALVAGFGGTAIYAATETDSHFMGMHGPPGPGGPDEFGPPHDRGTNAGPDGGADPATALHGEFVVADGKGGYTTMLAQTGAVTALGTNSVTARSADGFVQTYAVPSAATAAEFSVDEEVTIRATRTTASGQPIVTTIKTTLFARHGA